MRDNQLISLIIATILAQEEDVGLTGTPIKQAFQPTQQGVNKVKTAYMFKVSDRRVGSPGRSDVWVAPVIDPPTDGYEEHTEIQVYETTFQISVLSTQDPKNEDQYTASDILNYIAYILQSEKTLQALAAEEVGILRVGDVRNPAFVDDRERHEYNPSFDFTLTHKQIVQTRNKVLLSTELQILKV